MFDLTFNVDDKGMLTPLTLAIDQAVIAGWTGRDPVARDRHIAELEAIGIARPAQLHADQHARRLRDLAAGASRRRGARGADAGGGRRIGPPHLRTGCRNGEYHPCLI